MHNLDTMFCKMNKLMIAGWAVVFLLASCSKSNNEQPTEPGRTVMVYMAANNSLNGDAYANINQMERAYQNINGKLIVYARLKNTTPKIYEIGHDNSSEITSKVVKTYPEHNSSAPEVMSTVIADMKALAPAPAYGLVLWSHATSWLPDAQKALSYFGEDDGKTMDIKALAGALPNNLDFVLFDACSMASAEVLYELRGKSRYTVASPAEVVSVGMPYDKLLAHLFDADIRSGLISTCEAFYQYYNNQSGLYQSATISLIDNAQLDKLGTTVNRFFEQNQQNWTILKRDEVQRLDFADGSPTASFDMLDFFALNFPQVNRDQLEAALQSTVLYKANTPQFNGKPVRAYCGLSMYIPHADNAWAHPYYKTLGWYSAAGVAPLFKW